MISMKKTVLCVSSVILFLQNNKTFHYTTRLEKSGIVKFEGVNDLTSYKTAEVAAIIGVHPNTVRLYEKWGLIPAAVRQANGYRVFTPFHIQQFRLA